MLYWYLTETVTENNHFKIKPMNKKINTLNTIALIMLSAAIMVNALKDKSINTKLEQITERVERIEADTLTDWDIMWIAIAEKESYTNDIAKNPKSTASGRYQILKITVDEANRILKRKEFTYNDRFKPDRAFKILEVIQSHHNPTKCINKAIRLHSIGFANDPEMVEYFEEYKAKIDAEMAKIKAEQKQLRVEMDSVNNDLLDFFD